MTAPVIPDTRALARQRGPASGYLYGLNVLRIIASILVIYTHLASWFSTRGHVWLVSDWMDHNIIEPLHLNPHLSFIGVAIFLVVSGLVVTHVADRENPALFLRRRLARILPLLVAVTVVTWVLINLRIYRPEEWQHPLDLLDLVKGITFAGFFTSPEVILLEVTWTLLVQIVFYFYVTATIPLLRRYPWIPPAAAAAMICVVLPLATSMHKTNGHYLGIIAAYLPVLCIGQLISLIRTGKVNRVAGTVLGVTHFLLFVWADKLGDYTYTGTAHSRTLLLVIGLVLVSMTVAGRFSRATLTKNWSSRTYALYLIHTPCLYPVLDSLVPRFSWPLSLLLALILLGGLTELFHRFLEMPVDRWFRKRERKKTAPSHPVSR